MNGILVVLDGSPGCARALPLARRLAAGGVALQEVAASWSKPGRAGVAAARAVAASARRWDCDLLVAAYGRRGLASRLRDHPVAALARHTGLPLLAVPDGGLEAWPEGSPGPLIVPLDGSAEGEAIVEPARALAHALDAPVVLARALVAPYETAMGLPIEYANLDVRAARARAEDDLARVAARLAPLAVATVIEKAAPARLIARLARTRGACAVAMATHGRTGVARVMIGSVTVATLRRARFPVLVHSPGAAR